MPQLTKVTICTQKKTLKYADLLFFKNLTPPPPALPQITDQGPI